MRLWPTIVSPLQNVSLDFLFINRILPSVSHTVTAQFISSAHLYIIYLI